MNLRPSSQDLLQLLLLQRRQGGRELDVVGYDEVPSLVRRLAQWHTQVGVGVAAPGLGWASPFKVDLLAVDGSNSAPPTREGFLEFQIDFEVDVISVTRK